MPQQVPSPLYVCSIQGEMSLISRFWIKRCYGPVTPVQNLDPSCQAERANKAKYDQLTHFPMFASPTERDWWSRNLARNSSALSDIKWARWRLSWYHPSYSPTSWLTSIYLCVPSAPHLGDYDLTDHPGTNLIANMIKMLDRHYSC